MRTVNPRRVRMFINGLAIAVMMLISVAAAKPVMAQTASISGVVFADLNTNTSRENGEPGIQAVTVQLRNAANAVVDQDTTDADGAYGFAGVTAGTYTVVQADLPSYASTTPNIVEVTLTASQTVTVNFGDLRRQSATAPGRGFVWGFVLEDTNDNGLPDAGETGLANFTVTLFDESGNAVGDPVVTDANGFFEFPEVPAGIYTVKASPPGGPAGNVVMDLTVDVSGGELVTAVFTFAGFRLHIPLIPAAAE